MEQVIDFDDLQDWLFPLGYALNTDGEAAFFYKRTALKDVKNPYVFSMILVYIDRFSVRIEGLNEYRMEQALRSGAVKIEEPEDLDIFKEIVIETTLEDEVEFKQILYFFEQELTIMLENDPKSAAYAKSLKHVELLVKSANEVDIG